MLAKPSFASAAHRPSTSSPAAAPLIFTRPSSHPAACAQTLLARAQALLIAVDDTPTIDITVRRSFAPYLAAWLQDSAHHFGLHFPTTETP